jgi:hypothetical protein
MVIALFVGAAFIILSILADIARELSRHSFQAPPDLDSSDDWDVAADEAADTIPTGIYPTERRAVGRYPVGDHSSVDNADDWPAMSNAAPRTYPAGS